MFKVIGALVALYVCYTIATGRVFARAGLSGRTVSREESPGYFWVVVVVYGLLSLALIFVF